MSNVLKHVIIGSGAAGISAAKTLRERSESDEIVIISADDAVYSRCMLHKYISGERDVCGLSFIPENFFEHNKIKFCSGVCVTGIDVAGKSVMYEGGSESYDRLLIASGAVSKFPPVEGLSGTGNVYGLRDLSDAEAIRECAGLKNNIVIIGAGLVGLDAAYGLLEMGKKAVFVEMTDSILSANLDAHAAKVYLEKFTEAGCEFRLGARASKILSDDSGNVKTVVLDSGELLQCDLLIVAAGVSPATELLAGSGIRTERGVTVNGFLATSADDVYAAGDITGLSESWPNAVLQGEIAALNMLGITTEYSDNFSLMNTINFFGIPSLSVGRFIPDDYDDVDVREDKKRYQKIIVKDGVPVGVILQGDISRSGFWQYLIKNKIDIAGVQKMIWNVSFADSYGIDENGEYKWVV